LNYANSDELHVDRERPLSPDLNGLTCLATDKSWIVAGGDAWIVVFRDFEKLHRIQAYRDSVATCAVSQQFDLVVAGTNDGSLILWSCESGALTHAIELGKYRPIKILISPCWGFIVSYCSEIDRGVLKHHIFVHTINGLLVKRTEIVGAVDYWQVWNSAEGFDYLFYSTESGHWNVCEIYKIASPRLVHSSHSKVLAAYYSTDVGALVIGTSGSQVYFIPLRLETWEPR
jgi:WD40 repeat protein